MIFLGSGNFGEAVLNELQSLGRAPERVITQTTSIVALRAALIPRPDIALVASFGMILPREILDIPTHGFVNIHPSLLPKYRGPSPIQTAIRNADTETGVSLMVMDEEMDHGPLVRNFKFQMTNDKYTRPELETHLAQLGARLYHETIDDWMAGRIVASPQDHSRATYTKIVHRDDGRIDWSAKGETIDRMRRAYDPWPGIWTLYKGKRLKILNGSPLSDANPGASIGTVIAHGSALAVVCGDGLYCLDKVQLEGKKMLLMQEFVRGQKGFLSSILGS